MTCGNATVGDVMRRYAGRVAPRDLRALTAFAAGIEAARLTLHLHDPAPQGTQARLQAAVQARVDGKPVSRIIGNRLFWGRSFAVTADVLDPRPETEVLIAACLALGPQPRVLDLGTGSGAIAVTLASEWPRAQVVATDISAAALQVARTNAAALPHLHLVQSDWFDHLSGRFDLIVSNPPYIALDEMAALPREVAQHDPRTALTDEGDGLGAYRAICSGAPAFLEPGGWLMVEIGPSQGTAVRRLFEAAGFQSLSVLQDMDGRDRCVIGQKP